MLTKFIRGLLLAVLVIALIGAGAGLGTIAGIAVAGYDTAFPALTAVAGGLFGYAAAAAAIEALDA